jgi:uncharacterized protein (UPF0335 family)
MPRKSLKTELTERLTDMVAAHNAEHPETPMTLETDVRLDRWIGDVENTEIVHQFPGRQNIRQREAFTPKETGETIAAGQLRALVERIERLDEDRKEISEDIKEVYAEAKANGFDTAILRRVIALRRKPKAERDGEQAILDLYTDALGM